MDVIEAKPRGLLEYQYMVHFIDIEAGYSWVNFTAKKKDAM